MSSGGGTQIAFVRQLPGLGAQVFTMRCDGTDVRRLTGRKGQGECRRPCWSPDGLRLCYASRRDGYSGVYAVNQDGSAEERLTAEPAADDDFPAWSPDGERIVFSRGNRAGADALFVLEVASGATRRLTDHCAFESSPAWSPDGRFIAFHRAFGNPPGVYAMPAEGGEAWFLVPGDEPGWSPAGGCLAFAYADCVWLLELDAAGRPAVDALRLTDDMRYRDRHPSWSPDGTHIVFERQPMARGGPGAQIVVMRADSTAVTTLGEGRMPDWSPVPA